MVASSQESLFQEGSSHFEIKKHSSLAQINNITSLQQRKAINAIHRIVKDQLKRDPDARSFSIDLGILKRLAGIGRNDNTELKEGLKKLVSLVIEYNILGKDREEWGAFPFLSYVRIIGQRRGNTATLTFELPSIILDAIKNPSMYFKLNLVIQRGIKSKYGLALYEMLCDYARLGKITITIEDFRRMMGIEAEQYAVFTMLRKRVIVPAVEETNEKTDLSVSYTLNRVGRKVMSVTFTVAQKYKKTATEPTNAELAKKLAHYGIKPRQIAMVLDKHDEDYIMANIAIVEEELQQGKEIRNVPAYLFKAFEVDYRPELSDHERQEKEALQYKIEQIEQQAKAEEEFRRTYDTQRATLIQQHLDQLGAGEYNKLLQSFLATNQKHQRFAKLYANKGLEHPGVQSIRHNFIAKTALPKKWHSYEAFSSSSEVSVYDVETIE